MARTRSPPKPAIAANNVGTASVGRHRVADPAASTPHYVELDGVDDYVRVADQQRVELRQRHHRFAADLRALVPARRDDAHQLLGKGFDNATLEYKLHIASGLIRLDLRDRSAGALVSVFTGSQAALVGAWHHLAVVYDGRGGATAADGVTSTSTASPCR